MRIQLGIFLTIGVVASACDSNLVGQRPDTGVTDFGVIDAGGVAYPEGPYGTVAGTTIDNLTFSGFFSNDAFTGTSTTFSQFIDFQQVRNLGRYRYMLVNVAAEWCSGCRDEAVVLPDRFRQWDAMGGYVFSIMAQDALTRPATRKQLDDWLRLYPINYTMVYDPRDNMYGLFAPPGLPLNIIVNLETMQIERIRVGEDLGFLDIFESILQR